MLPFNLSFKRRYRRKIDFEILEEQENISAFYYQLYLERMRENRIPDPQESLRIMVMKGLGLQNRHNWEQLKIRGKYNNYLKSRNYAYKEGGMVQGTNIPVMFWNNTKYIAKIISWIKK